MRGLYLLGVVLVFAGGVVTGLALVLGRLRAQSYADIRLTALPRHNLPLRKPRAQSYVEAMNRESDPSIASDFIGDPDIVFTGEAARRFGAAHRAAGGRVEGVSL